MNTLYSTRSNCARCLLVYISRMNPIEAKLSRFGHNKMSNFSVAEVTEQIIHDTTELIRAALVADEDDNGAVSEISR